MRIPHLLLSFSILAATQAQWNVPAINTPVSGSAMGAATPLAAMGPDGSTYITWFENVTGAYVLKMQRLDADGVALWAAGGIVVSAEPQNSALFRFDFTNDHAGNAIVVFQDMRTGDLDVVAYKVAPDGSQLWPGGLPLPTPDATGIGPVTGVLSDDRIVFAWTTDRSPATVAYRVVESDGTFSGDPLELGGAGIHGRPKIVATSDGGFWLQYVVQQGSFLAPGTMQVVRCDATGASAAPVTLSTNTITGFHFPTPVSDGHDGLYIGFNSGNAANANLTDVYVQRLRANGTLWSATGTAVEVGASNQRFVGTVTPALVNDVVGLVMPYSETDLNQNQGRISVQRLDTAGTTLLGATGLDVTVLTSAPQQPFGNSATNDGAIISFAHGNSGSQLLLGHRFRLGDNTLTPYDVCINPGGMDDASQSPIRNGMAVAVWQDDREGGGIYAQRIMAQSTIGINESETGGILLLGGDTPQLLFQRTIAPSMLRVIDTQGRELIHQRLAAQTAGTVVPLPLSTMADGAYVVRVDGPGVSFSQKWVR